MGALLGMQAPPQISGRTFEDDPQWNGPDKIPPSTFFISAGPGRLQGKWYPTLMKPRDVGEELNRLGGNEDFKVVAQMKFSFDTAEQAIDYAAKLMTSVSVLNGLGGYSWPYFKHDKTKAQVEADDRRVRKADKYYLNDCKSKGTTPRDCCHACKSFTGHYSTCTGGTDAKTT